MVQLVDIGLNLTHDSFDDDREQVIAAAETVGVTRMIVTGTSVSGSEHAAELAAGDRRLYATAGIHPHHASDFSSADLDRLRALLAQPRVVASGECGLDYFRDFSPRADQQRCFAAQLNLAAESGRPVFLHQRDAHDDLLRILRPVRARLSGGVAHCFTFGKKELYDYLDLDLHIGVTGWVCDERRGDALRDAVPSIPLDRLLLETDAPYLLPRDLTERPRGRRNEPRFLPHVLARVAMLTGHPPELIADHATRNAFRLFGLDDFNGTGQAAGG